MNTMTGPAIDNIAARMDAAYAERRRHKPGSAGYADADARVEAVYADLRALNAARALREAAKDMGTVWGGRQAWYVQYLNARADAIEENR